MYLSNVGFKLTFFVVVVDALTEDMGDASLIELLYPDHLTLCGKSFFRLRENVGQCILECPKVTFALLYIKKVLDLEHLTNIKNNLHFFSKMNLLT